MRQLQKLMAWFRNRPQRLLKVAELCPGLPDSEPRVQWLGHSGYRLDWGGRVLMVDPVLARRVSVTPRLCELPPPRCLEGVTDLLISHAHMDHLDNATLERVASCDLHLPRRSERFLSARVRRRHRVHSFAPGAAFGLGGLQVSVVPARHGGWRYPWQRGHFACGFVVSDGHRVVYLAGDTAWGTHFAEIGQRFRPDTAILPIGGYAPRWFLRCRHLDPAEAAAAARALGARWVIPGHFGTYRVSLEPPDQPLEWFRREMASRWSMNFF
jgi:L-ascorbate metabolism protein UlaG (beta-lactamase superfamily)